MTLPRISSLLLASLLVWGSTDGLAEADARKDQVRAASAAWEAAYNARDVDLLMEQYTEDAVSMAPGFPASVGSKAVRADLEAFFAAFEVDHTTDIKEIIIVDDLAIERADYADAIAPIGGEAETEHGKHVVIRRLGDDGQCRVLWEIWNANPAAAE